MARRVEAGLTPKSARKIPTSSSRVPDPTTPNVSANRRAAPTRARNAKCNSDRPVVAGLRPSCPAAATRTTRLDLGLLGNLRGIVDLISLIPRSLAYVLLVGLPPEVRLYALSGTTGMQISHANVPACGSHAASFG